MALVDCDDKSKCWTVAERNLEAGAQFATLVRERNISADHIAVSESLDAFAMWTKSPMPGEPAAIHLCDMQTGLVKAQVPSSQTDDDIFGLSFSPDGKFLIAQGKQPDRQRVYALNDGMKELVLNDSYPRLTPDGRWVLVRDHTGVKVQDTATLHLHGELRRAGDCEITTLSPNSYSYHSTIECALAPDNKTVVVSYLHRPQEADPLTVLLSHFRGARPTSQLVRTARLWDLEQCEELAEFEDHRDALYSPESHSLAIKYSGGTIRVWDVPPRKPVLAILGGSLVLWLSVLVGIQLWGRFVRFHALRNPGS
jgi:WD40 repeat protein